MRCTVSSPEPGVAPDAQEAQRIVALGQCRDLPPHVGPVLLVVQVGALMVACVFNELEQDFRRRWYFITRSSHGISAFEFLWLVLDQDRSCCVFDPHKYHFGSSAS